MAVVAAVVLVAKLAGKQGPHLTHAQPLGQERKEYYNTYFLVPRRDGGIHPILNLKHFHVNIRK